MVMPRMRCGWEVTSLFVGQLIDDWRALSWLAPEWMCAMRGSSGNSISPARYDGPVAIEIEEPYYPRRRCRAVRRALRRGVPKEPALGRH